MIYKRTKDLNGRSFARNKRFNEINKGAFIKSFITLKQVDFKVIKYNTPLYKIWLYIDPNCESCIEKFPVVERLTEIMQGENIEIDILWRQEPKKTLVDTLDISKDKQYRTGSIKVLNEYPTYFITDEENSVQMISDDIDKIVKKMLSLDEIEKNAIIKETNIYLKKLIGQNDKQKQKLVYFAMDGCPDCQNVEKLLNDNSIASKYDMITIYTVDSKGEKECVDEGEVLKNIYDIDWYPSFLILDGDKYEFIGQESDEKLLEKLKDGIT